MKNNIKYVDYCQSQVLPMKLVLAPDFRTYKYVVVNGVNEYDSNSDMITTGGFENNLSKVAFDVVHQYFKSMASCHPSTLQMYKNNDSRLVTDIPSIMTQICGPISAVENHCSLSCLYDFFELVAYYGNEFLKILGCFGTFMFDFNRYVTRNAIDEGIEHLTAFDSNHVCLFTKEKYLQAIKDCFAYDEDPYEYLQSVTFGDLVEAKQIEYKDLKTELEQIPDSLYAKYEFTNILANCHLYYRNNRMLSC